MSEPESASSSQESAGGAFCFFANEEEDLEGVGLMESFVSVLSSASGYIMLVAGTMVSRIRTTLRFCHSSSLGDK